jgi:transcriptional regulator with XRE-family HTH domain
MELNEWLAQQFKYRPDINQTSLALSIGVSQSTVSKWLRGTATPDPDNCHKVAQFFGVPAEDVLAIAGHLLRVRERDPPYSAESPALGEALHLFNALDDDDQERILVIMRSFLTERRRRGEDKEKSRARASPA